MVFRSLILGGTTLSLGSSAIGSLPVTPATAGIQSGIGSAGSFFPVMGTIGGAGLTLKQIRKLNKKDKIY